MWNQWTNTIHDKHQISYQQKLHLLKQTRMEMRINYMTTQASLDSSWTTQVKNKKYTTTGIFFKLLLKQEKKFKAIKSSFRFLPRVVQFLLNLKYYQDLLSYFGLIMPINPLRALHMKQTMLPNKKALEHVLYQLASHQPTQHKCQPSMLNSTIFSSSFKIVGPNKWIGTN